MYDGSLKDLLEVNDTLARFSMLSIAAADQGTEYLPSRQTHGDMLRHVRANGSSNEQPYARPSSQLGDGRKDAQPCATQ
jgi:hypothetical protein